MMVKIFIQSLLVAENFIQSLLATGVEYNIKIDFALSYKLKIVISFIQNFRPKVSQTKSPCELCGVCLCVLYFQLLVVP